MADQVLAPAGSPHVRRWREQRWLIDNMIRAVGMEWDQSRLGGLQATLGPEAAADIAGVRHRVQKYDDIAPAFEAAARHRAAKARTAADLEQRITARENFFMAANYWASAQWPIDVNNETNLFYNQQKRECYARYGELADHHVEAAWVPSAGRALPAWFHLPPGYQGGKIPVAVLIPGMDGFKERIVSLYGDRWLNRGIAVLAIEGPGQYESAVLDIRVRVDAWAAVGTAVVDWLSARAEIDPQRIGIVGSSFGSLFATIAFANEPRFRACAVSATCLEPGGDTIFEQASPTFKKRFMYMAGFTDEDLFDDFRKTLTWEGHIDKITAPYLCVAGEADELSPLVHTDRMMAALTAPKRLLVYAGARHGINGVPSASFGPFFPTLIADWMVERFAGKPFESVRSYIDATGKETAKAYPTH